MRIKFYQRIVILPVLVLLSIALVPWIASGDDSIVISHIKLTNSEADSGGGKFGSSMAIDGSNLGIGAILADGGADNSGAAYLFKVTDSSDFPQTKLSGNGAAKTGDNFGNSLDISGDTLVIGAHWMDDGDILNTGAAFVVRSSYDETTETWTITEQTRLNPSEPSKGAEFGNSVAISGNTVVVGDYKAEAVYVFEYDGSSWAEKARLTAGDAQGGEKFGFSVAIDGDTLAVGATKGGKGDVQTGSVYVFTYNGSDWEEETELFTEDLVYNDQFGYSVAIEGDTILVGAPRNDEEKTDSGAAYVFRRNAGTWFPDEPKLKGSGLFEKAYFGTSVSLSGNTAVIGAYRNDLLAADGTPIEDIGSAYLFRFDGSEWKEKQTLIPVDAVGGEEFGWAVAISGDTVVVGAHKDGDLAGSAYVFTLAPENHLPVADAGENLEVEEGSPVTLDGSDSYDLDGDDLSYSWTQIGEPSVGLDTTNEAKLTFTAPPCLGENLLLTFQLVVSDTNKADSPPDEVNITVLPSTKSITEINSVLDWPRRPWGIDKDIYTFHGSQGDKVIVTLRAKTGGKNNNGDRATLKLKDNIRGVSFYRVDSSRLPNKISATLPATGQYHVLVAGQPRFFRGKRFLGEYTLTVEGASSGIVDKGPGSPVARKKSGYSSKPHKQHPVWSWISSWFGH